MVLGTLIPSLHRDGDMAGKPSTWITFKDAKRQVRALLKTSSHPPTGSFRPRRINRSELCIPVDGGFVTVKRKPGAEVIFNSSDTIRTLEDMSPEDIAAIVAMG